MNLLILGGNRFIGRALCVAAQARGHAVTTFNRGNLPAPPGVEAIVGDRHAFALPAGRTWDAVVDASGWTPGAVRASAALLRDRIERYAFISSISVYPQPMQPGTTEDAAVETLPDGADPEDASNTETYGARKAQCEAVLEDALPGRVLTLRCGFVVGPHDYTDRLASMIERAAQPAPFIVPGDPAQPIQLIDARDLAAWIIALLERGATGPYNATGPERPMRIDTVAQTCIDATGSTASLLVVPSDEVKAAGAVPWQHIAFWFEPEEAGLVQTSIARASAAGLRFRPFSETVRDTYAWLRSSDHARKIALPREIEATILRRSCVG